MVGARYEVSGDGLSVLTGGDLAPGARDAPIPLSPTGDRRFQAADGRVFLFPQTPSGQTYLFTGVWAAERVGD